MSLTPESLHFWTLAISIFFIAGGMVNWIFGPNEHASSPLSHLSARLWAGEALYLLSSCSFVMALVVLARRGLVDFEAAHGPAFVLLVFGATASLALGALAAAYVTTRLASILRPKVSPPQQCWPASPSLDPMNIFDEIATAGGQQASTIWARSNGWTMEERPFHDVRKIVVEGSTDVVLCRGQRPRMIVASEAMDGLARIHTETSRDKLVIDQEPIIVGGVSIRSGSATQFFHGTVIRGGIAAGDIINTRSGRQGTTSFSTGRTMIAIVVPGVAAISIRGSANFYLFDLIQEELSLAVKGSGDIEAMGQVQKLEIDISGSSDIDTSELVSQHADIAVSGSGDVRAHVVKEVRARVSGSGTVRISGNPPQRDHRVSGSGDVRFK